MGPTWITHRLRVWGTYGSAIRNDVGLIWAVPDSINVGPIWDERSNFSIPSIHSGRSYNLWYILNPKYAISRRYNSGATMPGKKGTKVCLNIFADFAYIHTEWKDQKGLGWSPGYTVQTILMNVVRDHLTVIIGQDP